MRPTAPRPTHVRVIIAPLAGYLKLEGCASDAFEGTVFSVEDAKAIYAFMQKKGKELNRDLKVWVAEKGAKIPEVKFNWRDNSPYMALVTEARTPGRSTKVIL
jgi:hypothetical protein